MRARRLCGRAAAGLTGPCARRGAAKAKLLLRLVKQATEARHADVLRTFRVLVAEDVLVLGCVEQARAAAPRAASVRA